MSSSSRCTASLPPPPLHLLLLLLVLLCAVVNPMNVHPGDGSTRADMLSGLFPLVEQQQSLSERIYAVRLCAMSQINLLDPAAIASDPALILSPEHDRDDPSAAAAAAGGQRRRAWSPMEEDVLTGRMDYALGIPGQGMVQEEGILTRCLRDNGANLTDYLWVVHDTGGWRNWTTWRWCDLRPDDPRCEEAHASPAPVTPFAFALTDVSTEEDISAGGTFIGLLLLDDTAESLQSVEAAVQEVVNARREANNETAAELDIGPDFRLLAEAMHAAGASLDEPLGGRDQRLFEEMRSMYEEFADDLRRVRRQARAFRWRVAHSAIEDLEAELTYLRIRRRRPRRVCEVGALCGYSSFWILSALYDNHRAADSHSSSSSSSSSYPPPPELHTYDLVDCSNRPGILPPHLAALRRFHHGDVFQAASNVSSSAPPIFPEEGFDYFFVDAEHTAGFARRYTSELFEKVAARRPSGASTAAAPSSDLLWSRPMDIGASVHEAMHFPGGASEEGAVVVDWLAKMSPSRRREAFSINAMFDTRLHIELMRLRERLGITRGGILDALHWCTGGICEKNSMLFFDFDRETDDDEDAVSPPRPSASTTSSPSRAAAAGPQLTGECPNPNFRLSAERRLPENSVLPIYSGNSGPLHLGKDQFLGRKALEIGGPTNGANVYSMVAGHHGDTDLFTNVIYPMIPVGESSVGGGSPEASGRWGAPEEGGPYGEWQTESHYRKLGTAIRREGSNLHGVESSSFGVVFASHVLEHFFDPIAALIEWDRVLEDGGILILVLPYAPNTFDADISPVSAQELLWRHHDTNSTSGPSEEDLTRHAERFHRNRRMVWDFDGTGPKLQAPAEDLRAEIFARCPALSPPAIRAAHDAESNAEVRRLQASCKDQEEMVVDEAMVHWHVFDFNVLMELVEGCLGYELATISYHAPWHQVLIAQKPVSAGKRASGGIVG